MFHAVLAAVSGCYPPRIGRLLTRYSPVRHSVISLPPRRTSKKCFVRLECVKHAASVHPEPGSNSLKFCISSAKVSSCRKYLFQSAILASYFLKYFVFKVFNEILIRSFVVQFPKTKPASSEAARLFYHIPTPFVNPFFSFLFIFFSFFEIYSRSAIICEKFFSFFVTNASLSVKISRSAPSSRSFFSPR